MNLKNETLAVLKYHKKKIQDIKFIVCGNKEIEIDDFFAAADIEYDEDYGTAEVNTSLAIVGDGWWLERYEYDGSESWEFRKEYKRPAKKYSRRYAADAIFSNYTRLKLRAIESRQKRVKNDWQEKLADMLKDGESYYDVVKAYGELPRFQKPPTMCFKKKMLSVSCEAANLSIEFEIFTVGDEQIFEKFLSKEIGSHMLWRFDFTRDKGTPVRVIEWGDNVSLGVTYNGEFYLVDGTYGSCLFKANMLQAKLNEVRKNENACGKEDSTT